MLLSEVLKDESCWIRNYLAKDVNDEHVNYDSPMAVKWCLLGARMKVDGLYRMTRPQLCEAIAKVLGENVFYDRYNYSPVNFNNDPETTWPLIKKVVEAYDATV